jgi:hypothetical protein
LEKTKELMLSVGVEPPDPTGEPEQPPVEPVAPPADPEAPPAGAGGEPGSFVTTPDISGDAGGSHGGGLPASGFEYGEVELSGSAQAATSQTATQELPAEDPVAGDAARPSVSASANEEATAVDDASAQPTQTIVTGDMEFESNSLFEPMTEKPAKVLAEFELESALPAMPGDSASAAPVPPGPGLENDAVENEPPPVAEQGDYPAPEVGSEGDAPGAMEPGGASSPAGGDRSGFGADAESVQPPPPEAGATWEEPADPFDFDDVDGQTPAAQVPPPPPADGSVEATPTAADGPPFDLSDDQVWIPEEDLPEELRDEHSGKGAVVQVQDIVGQFSAEVKADVDAEDYRSHYDLGMAYLEMDLLPEAIREFQFAANAETYQVRCLEMIGLCFLNQNQPRLAIKQLEKGINLVGDVDKESLGLMYNLGLAYEMLGDAEQAKLCFEDVYVVDVMFRDITDKMNKYSS